MTSFNTKDGSGAGIASLITVLLTALSDNRNGSGKVFLPYLTNVQRILSTIKTFLENSFLFVFTAVWLFIAGLPYGVFLFWRWTNLLYIRLRWGFDLTDLVDGLDIIGTIDEPNSKQVIMSLNVLKGQYDLEEFRSRCEKSVSRIDNRGKLMFPKFHQFLDTIGGYYCWKPAKFDINHHVRIMDGVDPDKVFSETEVMDLLSQHANKPFAKERAPWEILLIPHFMYNKEATSTGTSDKFAMVLRIHHGIGDGFSLMKFIMRDVAGEDPEAYKPPVKNPGKPWPWWYRIFAFFYILWHSPRCFYKEMSVKDSNPLHNALTKVSGEKSIVWSEPINVKWLKELKAEMKVGMNAMLFGAVGGALRAYILQEHGASKLPSEINALVPLPVANHPNNKMINKFAVVLYPLECKSNDPRVRCSAIEKAGKEIAVSPEPHVNLFLAQLIGVAPTIFSKFFIYNTQSTVVFSNLPGPDKSIELWGKKLIETMFWLPNVGHSGISVSFLSYKDNLRIGITVDKSIIPQGDAKKLIDLTVCELEKMCRLVGISHKGNRICDDLRLEPDAVRHNSEDDDSSSSGFAEEESLEDEDEYCQQNAFNHNSAQLEQTEICAPRSRKTISCITEYT